MIVFLILGVLFLGIAVASLLGVLNARRLRTAERLAAIHGFGFRAEGHRVQLPDEAANPLAGLLVGIGDVVARFAGSVGEEEVRRELMRAGMYRTSPKVIIGSRVLAALMLPVLAAVLIGTSDALHLLVVAMMLPAGWVLPLTVVQRRARLRLAEIDRRLPDLIDMLCVMIEAGVGFLAAMRMAAGHFTAPLGDELLLTLQEQTMGLTVPDALGNMSRRCETPAMTSFVRSMANGEKMGISTGQIMRNLSHEMRIRRRRDAEERAQKAPIRMLFPLVFLIFPAMFIVLLVPGALELLKAF